MQWPLRAMLVTGVTCLVGAAALPRLEAILVHEAGTRSRIESQWNETLGMTRFQLASLVTETMNDRSLIQNFSWGYSNSVVQSLTARLRMGELEQIEVFDADCKSLARVHLRASLPLNCPGKASESDIRSAALNWAATGDQQQIPVLTVERRLTDPGRGATWIVGAVPLDDQWLVVRPALAHMMRRHSLRINTAAPSSEDAAKSTSGSRWTLAREGGYKTNQPRIELQTSEIGLAWLGLGSTSRQSGLEAIRLLLTLGALLSFFAVITRQWRTRQTDVDERRAFDSWCGGLADPQRENADEKNAGASDDVQINTWKQSILSAIRVRDEQIRNLKTQRRQIDRSLEEKDKQIAGWVDHVADLATLDSLSEQMQRTTRPFLDRATEMRDRLEQLDATIAESIHRQTNEVAGVLTRWQQGIAERGMRKFLRSMSETQGRTADRSVLDDDIDLMATASGLAIDGALHAKLSIRSLETDMAFVAKMVGGWHALATRDTSRDGTTDPEETVQHAVAMLRMNTHLPSINSIWRVTSPEAALMPRLPTVIFASAIYHCWLAALEQAGCETIARARASTASPKDADISVITRFRENGARRILVITTTSDKDSTVSTDSERQRDARRRRAEFHLGIARAMLRGFNIELGVMPVLSGAAPISIGWLSSTVSAASRPEELVRPAESETSALPIKLSGASLAPLDTDSSRTV